MKTNQKNYTVISFIMFLFITACGNKAVKADVRETDSLVADTVLQSQMHNAIEPELAIPFPAIPETIIDPRSRAKYLLDHYWDKLDFNDVSFLNSPDKLEASFANFLAITISFPVSEVEANLITPLTKSKGKMLNFFLDNYEKYLYEPNSPMFNEEYYIPILKWQVKSPKISLARQTRSESVLKLTLLNRVGEKAQNFIYTMADGSKHHLNNIRTPYTLLIFYVPGCRSCELTVDAIKKDMYWREKVEKGQLDILFIYADNDLSAWKNTLISMPDFVKIGYDEKHEILSKPLYDLKASPTIYLLNNMFEVLLKDTSLEKVKSVLKD